ncbi:Cytochrome P450 [Streptomyces zhaozhouensis]|uniref:Cytochrome P450 n=1 Tax=Streptomyces zhaozhouensis TaxID=1300267 RepID=A0A286DU52_9ACTN|nr:cytochrome P450 [Streptomyces zhaozhouensis]SOD62197.1 Cytochrome P450 [Streptomyces zhaozhouensis]
MTAHAGNIPPTALSEEPPEFPMPRASGCPFDPPPPLRERQREGALTRVRLWDGSTPWLVTRYAEQRALMADARLSADITRPGYPSGAPVPPRGNSIGFILMDDPEHARLRRMVTAPFAVKRVNAMAPRIQRIVDELIDAMLAGPRPVDLVEAFALPVPSMVICELLGVPYADHAFFQENSKTIINREVTQEQRSAALGRLTDYLDGLLGEKLRAPQDDLLSGLAERVGGGELTRREAAQMGVLLLIAGHETTANMIALGTLALLRHPEQLAALRDTDDEKLVSGAVEELLRYLHITHSGRRRAVLEDIEIAGETLRAGEGVILANDIGNRDPSAFPGDPDTLDIRRDARHHVAFGYGAHQCLGQPLARLELRIVYGTLYRRVPTLRLAAELEELPFKHDGSVYGVYELPVSW